MVFLMTLKTMKLTELLQMFLRFPLPRGSVTHAGLVLIILLVSCALLKEDCSSSVSTGVGCTSCVGYIVRVWNGWNPSYSQG
jgi:hypothetical protein